MNSRNKHLLAALVAIALVTGACVTFSTSNPTAIPTSIPAQPLATATSTSVNAVVIDENQPVRINGDFKYSNDFVTETYYVEHAVALADMTGFVLRDKEWEAPVESQTLGFMDLDAENNHATFRLELPAMPSGTLNDVDNDDSQNDGVQIFAVAYSPNLTGGPFSEGDDASFGWPAYLASVKTDTENQDEVTGGALIVWAPDDQQQFPTGFGDDQLLFTADDPVAPIPTGYSMIDLDKDPFQVVRKSELFMELYEPADIALKDYSTLSYTEAFEKMVELLEKEYAFNDIEGKAPDWDAVYEELSPLVEQAENDSDPAVYFEALKQFTYAFKDGHVGLDGGEIGNQDFMRVISGGYGFAIRELEDGSAVVIFVLEDGPADQAGMEVGAEVTQFNGEAIEDAIGEIEAYAAPFSTEFAMRYQQARYLLRAQPGTQASVTFSNPTGSAKTVTLKAVAETDSFSFTSVYKDFDSNALPVEFSILESGVGYIKINSNYDDLNLIVRLFERALKTFEANSVLGVIIDMRMNSGGSPLGLAGFFTDEEIPLGQLEYYSDKTSQFEPDGPRDKFLPNQNQYSFSQMALLVGQACASACEIEAYGFSQLENMIVVGEYPSAGVEAEVGRGQFLLPEGMSFQAPTGRFTLPDRSIFLEGVGVQPTVKVPITAENVLSDEDVILKTAEKAILEPPGTGITPSGPPEMASIAEAQAGVSSAYTLEELAREQYSDAEFSQMDRVFTYTVALPQSQDVIWSWGWCATTQDILDDNIEHIEISLSLNGEDVSLDDFASFEGENNGQFCRFYYTLLSDWPAGQHSLQTIATFTEPINDGSLDYPAGTQTFQFDVYIKP
ncbi:MAG: hypothetical protein JW908_16225 [Anaerolineales bacterium]|nr:hypothetical protein [Anaerolineales bacterium]